MGRETSVLAGRIVEGQLGNAAMKRAVGARRSLNALGSAGSLPVYHQLSSILRQRIKDGLYCPDKAMPSEMQLSESFDVSRVTVRRALEMLEGEGLVVRRHGVGTFARAQNDNLAPNAHRISGLVENVLGVSGDTRSQLLSYENGAATPADVLQAMQLEPGSTTLRIERLCIYRNNPFSVSTVYLSHAHAHLAQEHMIDERSIIDLLEGSGVLADRAEQTISAMPADDYAAAKLNVGISTPLLRLRRTVFTRDGAVLAYNVALCNPDIYDYQTMLMRDNSAERAQWRHVG